MPVGANWKKSAFKPLNFLDVIAALGTRSLRVGALAQNLSQQIPLRSQAIDCNVGLHASLIANRILNSYTNPVLPNF